LWADAIIDGEQVRHHYFCMDLPHSDAPFFKTYPSEVAEAFCAKVKQWARRGFRVLRRRAAVDPVRYIKLAPKVLFWQRYWATGRGSFDCAGFRLSCVARQAAVLRGHTLSIGERLQADVTAFMPHFQQTGTGGAF